jgi:hypothetical protein
MDKIEKYQKAILELLQEYADYYNGNLDYNVSMEPSGTKAAELKKLRRIIK